MRHQIGVRRAPLLTAILDNKGVRDSADLRVGPGQADQTRMELRGIGANDRRGVTRRIDGDEDRLDTRGGFGILPLELFKPEHQPVEIDRADVGTKAVTEIDKPVFAGKVRVGHRPAVAADQHEWPANARALERRFCRHGSGTTGGDGKRCGDEACAGDAAQTKWGLVHGAVRRVTAISENQSPCGRRNRLFQDDTAMPRLSRLSSPAFAALALSLSGLAAIAAAPATAQLFSESYEFLEAVRERDGTKAMELLNGPSSTLINTRDRSTGETALHIAVARRDMTWLNFLTQRGADTNLTDRSGLTPLISAAQIGFVEGTQALIARGARVNLANGRGETALHIAVQRRDIAMVRALVAAGADADIQDNIAGKSPRDYATEDTRATAVLAALDTRRPAAVTSPSVAGPN